MKIVIDANILFSALLKDGITREILKSESLEICAPDFLIEEFRKYFSEVRVSDELIKKLRVSRKELQELLELLLSNIELVSISEYSIFLEKIEISDEKDKPYLAVALLKDASVWSNDENLKEQSKIVVYNTAELMNILNTKKE